MPFDASNQTPENESALAAAEQVLYTHQREALERADGREAFAYLMGMGCDKTATLLAGAARHYSRGEINGLLVLAPAGVHRQWINEQVPQHCPVPYEAIAYRSQPPKRLQRRIDEVLSASGVLRIVAVNVEALQSKSGKNFVDRVLKSGGAWMTVIDESTRIKTPSAQRTKFCMYVGKLSKYRRILTGSPIANGLEDVYSQFAFLDRSIIGAKTAADFRSRYCIMGGFENREIVGYRNQEELQEKISSASYRISKDEALDLPDRLYQHHDVELSKEQKQAYNDLRTQLLTEFNDGSIAGADQAVTQLLRLQQVLGGHLPREDGSIQELPCLRIDALHDVVNRNEPTIIWARFRPEIDRIVREFGTDAVRYDGTVSERERERAIERFRNGDARVLVAQPDSAGYGLNLAHATHAVCYSPTFSYETYSQACDRNHRIGQQNRVLYTHMRAPGTVDDKIIKALERKQGVATQNLEAIRQLIVSEG